MTARISILIAVALAAIPAVAQQSQNRQQSGTMAASAPSLPPALRAALLVGNPQAVRQAINTLSQGNPLQATNLAVQAVKVAEQMLASNPQAAVANALAAVDVVQTPIALQSNPQGAFETLSTATRIAMSPDAQKVVPNQVLALASAIANALRASPMAQSPQAAGIFDALHKIATSPSIAAADPNGAARLTEFLAAPNRR